MKKISLVLATAFILAGCSSSKETVTVCSTTDPINGYSSGEQVFHAKGDKVTLMNNKLLLETSSKDELDSIIESFESFIDEINSYDGVTARFEKIDDTSIYDILEVDTTVTSNQTLIDIGLLAASDADIKFISLELSVEGAEASGMTCTVQE